MESKLDQLKRLVADMFKEAEDKHAIEQSIAVNNAIKDVETEQQALVDKNAELLSSYKDLVMHTSFKDDNKPVDNISPVAPSFEDALSSFIANEQKK